MNHIIPLKSNGRRDVVTLAFHSSRVWTSHRLSQHKKVARTSILQLYYIGLLIIDVAFIYVR